VCLSSVLVSGMRPSTGYKLIVYAENGVSLQSGTVSAQDIDIITDVAGRLIRSHLIAQSRRHFFA